jgi:hypothetical protein
MDCLEPEEVATKATVRLLEAALRNDDYELGMQIVDFLRKIGSKGCK